MIELEIVCREVMAMDTRANPLWGAPRIHGELWKLGFEVSGVTRLRLAGGTEIALKNTPHEIQEMLKDLQFATHKAAISNPRTS